MPDESKKGDKDEGKKTSIDWSKASDEQLAAAGAEQKRRQPFTDFEDEDWVGMPDKEFVRKRSGVFAEQRQRAKNERTIKDHAELEAERQSRAKRQEKAAGE